jgi:hypothetical protein
MTSGLERTAFVMSLFPVLTFAWSLTEPTCSAAPVLFGPAISSIPPVLVCSRPANSKQEVNQHFDSASYRSPPHSVFQIAQIETPVPVRVANEIHSTRPLATSSLPSTTKNQNSLRLSNEETPASSEHRSTYSTVITKTTTFPFAVIQ